ncbi:MAG: hypothetical protein U9R37_00670 [Campylobacterota bacterium]|nr:hypothetical protein [Campylobacterota bacterium]
MSANLKKAFSLIELIFIIAVLGIISSVAIPKLLNTKSGATVSTIKQDISTITTSIQSYYIINDKIDKITDSININEKVWSVEDKKLTYSVDTKECITIAVVDKKLDITISKDNSDMCQKLYDSGIRTISYDLE